MIDGEFINNQLYHLDLILYPLLLFVGLLIQRDPHMVTDWQTGRLGYTIIIQESGEPKQNIGTIIIYIIYTSYCRDSILELPTH